MAALSPSALDFQPDEGDTQRAPSSSFGGRRTRRSARSRKKSVGGGYDTECMAFANSGAPAWLPTVEFFKETMLIPNDQIGRIIGRKGKTFGWLSEVSGARIELPDAAPGFPAAHRTVSIYGNPDQIFMCINLILMKITPIEMGGTAGPQEMLRTNFESAGERSKLLLGEPTFDALRSQGGTTTSIYISTDDVGRVIGKKGKHFIALQSMTGASCRLPPQEENLHAIGYRELIITGSPEQVKEVVHKVTWLTNQKPLLEKPKLLQEASNILNGAENVNCQGSASNTVEKPEMLNGAENVNCQGSASNTVEKPEIRDSLSLENDGADISKEETSHELELIVESPDRGLAPKDEEEHDSTLLEGRELSEKTPITNVSREATENIGRPLRRIALFTSSDDEPSSIVAGNAATSSKVIDSASNPATESIEEQMDAVIKALHEGYGYLDPNKPLDASTSATVKGLNFASRALRPSPTDVNSSGGAWTSTPQSTKSNPLNVDFPALGKLRI